jgi:uncharacterized damage-inducible protein DinB
MSVPFPSPTDPAASRTEVFLRYLDYFRDRLVAKLEGLPEDELRLSRLPSGWTPLELLQHLRYVERRWLEWGFEGVQVDDPWPEATFADLVAALQDQAVVTREVGTTHDLDELGQPGPRWDGADPATLERVLFHLVQEYARHVGHIDVVAELASGAVGE